MKSVGVIDIGTNTILCLKAFLIDNRIDIIFDKRYHYRAGRRLDDDGNISFDYKNSLSQTAAIALKDLADCAHIKIVATEVFRRPKDGAAFAKELSAQIGRNIEIIDPRREAELSFSGALYDENEIKGRIAVIDVGGGSTELALGLDGKLTDWSGVKIGAVAISEAVGFNQPASQYIGYAANTFRYSNFLDLLTPKPDKIIAVGGSAVALAGLSVGLKIFQPEKIQGQRIGGEALRKMLEQIAGINLKQREELMAFDPQRADIIVGGGCIILAFMELAAISEIVISAYGLRYGLLREIAAEINA
jgi:exopolyphosphatase / guanosine-5'-triphosphate,3'-diphosphate pyrophosphatase